MGVFVSSTSAFRRHGAAAIERTPPAALKAAGSGVAVLAGQFPWGPGLTVLTTPAGIKERNNIFAPAGMTRTGSAVLGMIRRGFPTLKLIRIVKSTAVAAFATLANAVPTNLVTVTLKYAGTEGNAAIATVSAAGDGDANHFNLEVTVTGPSGTSTDSFTNLNYSGTGPDSVPDLSNCILVGAITKLAAGRPTNATYTFASGTTPALASSDYVGTQGTGDKGLAVAESDKSIRHVHVDDPGSSLRAAVNSGIMGHVGQMTDRVGYINGDSGLSLAATKTDAANYRSSRMVYVDPWVRILDDVTGVKTLAPPAGFAVSVASQGSPSTSIAWKDPEFGDMLNQIVELENNRGEGAADNTDAGICTIIQEEDGGWRFEAGVVTIAPSDPVRRNLTRTRMGDYVATSFVRSTRSSVDAPNVPQNQQDILNAVSNFMATLKANQKGDPNHTPHVLDWSMGNLGSVNSQADLDAGQFIVPVDMKTSSGIEHLFLSIRFGESVVVSTAA